MQVFFHPDFYQVYTSDPAAEAGRMEAVVAVIESAVTFQEPRPATMEEIAAAHSPGHIEWVRSQGLFDIAALAAGGAVGAAEAGMQAPAFALVRPPGHHASADSAWGFCYFNHMAIALHALKHRDLIHSAFVLDFDLHYGDGNVNILGSRPWAAILNPDDHDRRLYLEAVARALAATDADVIAVSAGFDNHLQDWGGLLTTDDYRRMGAWVRKAARRNKGGCFGILEGGYNHVVLGQNVVAFIDGLRDRR